MTAPTDRLPQSGLVPVALLAGVLCAFVGCCLAGRVAVARNCFSDFQRFHQAISPPSLFYPTARQVQALGRDRLDRDRIAVIVGGSSVLRGYGQGPEEVWTRHLQEALGDGYRVLNLAMNGAMPAEFGGTAAEVLAQDFPRLLFVSDINFQRGLAQAPLPPEVRAAAVPEPIAYAYFFWDAYFKGLVPADALRAYALRAAAHQRADEARFAEPMRGLRLDGVVYSRDLWTTLAYSHFSTVFAPLLAPASFVLPRRRFPENEQNARVPSLTALRQTAPLLMDGMRRNMRAEVEGSRRLLRQAAGNRLPQRLFPGDSPYLVFPPGLRGRTLLLALRFSPSFVDPLSPSERADYRAAFPLFVRELEKAGFAAVEVEAGYTAADFVDHYHLTESGGRKLAAEVAPAVRHLARRLGYVKDGPASARNP